MNACIEYKGRRIVGNVWFEPGDRSGHSPPHWVACECGIESITIPCGRRLDTSWLIISWMAKAGLKHRDAILEALADQAYRDSQASGYDDEAGEP